MRKRTAATAGGMSMAAAAHIVTSDLRKVRSLHHNLGSCSRGILIRPARTPSARQT